MPVGKVKWFDGRKGFGFVLDDQGRDVFVHFSVITGDGFRSLEECEEVEYEVEQGPKGLLAKNVKRVNPPKVADPAAAAAAVPAPATVGADATATPVAAAAVAEAPVAAAVVPAAAPELEPRPMRQPQYQPQYQPQHYGNGGGGGGGHGGYQKFGKKQKQKNRGGRSNQQQGRGQQNQRGQRSNVNGNVATPVREGAQPFVPNQPAANVAGAMERYLERMKRSWGQRG